ncbi:hypothetical protein [Luteolibacter soli]|uniref:Uncharacterized protein n=1 Tax=Luteolibacter soli TaxID=3135280 RepID=A0ABU9AQU7_9BACT
MLSKSHFLLVGVIASGTVLAEPPADKGHSHLWLKSPFTNPPLPPVHDAPDPLNDWALGGVSEVEGGYMVTLVNTKNQGETQVIKPRGTVHSTKDEMKWLNPGAPGSFKVEKVEFDKTNWKDTTVLISSGSNSATMKFSDTLLAPTAPAAPAGGNRPSGQPVLPPNPAVVPPAPQPGNPVKRPSHPPVLPPAPHSSGRSNR